MKKIIILIITIFISIFAIASNNDEYVIVNEHKDYTSMMKIIVKNNKIVSVSFDRKNKDSRSWIIDNKINQEYQQKYGETYREMKTKLIRAAQSKNEDLPEVADKELYEEFKNMFEYLLNKIIKNQNGTYQLN